MGQGEPKKIHINKEAPLTSDGNTMPPKTAADNKALKVFQIDASSHHSHFQKLKNQDMKSFFIPARAWVDLIATFIKSTKNLIVFDLDTTPDGLMLASIELSTPFFILSGLLLLVF